VRKYFYTTQISWFSCWVILLWLTLYSATAVKTNCYKWLFNTASSIYLFQRWSDYKNIHDSSVLSLQALLEPIPTVVSWHNRDGRSVGATLAVGANRSRNHTLSCNSAPRQIAFDQAPTPCVCTQCAAMKNTPLNKYHYCRHSSIFFIKFS